MSRAIVHLWKISEVSEIKNFISRKAYIFIIRTTVKYKGMKPLPLKWVVKRKENPDIPIHLKPRDAVKGYM